MISCGEVVGLATLAAQNMGRTGPIPPGDGGPTWTSLTAVALLLAAISGIVAFVGARQSARPLASGRAVACVLFSFTAAYSVRGWAG